jgi:hypothetical protein
MATHPSSRQVNISRQGQQEHYGSNSRSGSLSISSSLNILHHDHNQRHGERQGKHHCKPNGTSIPGISF